MPAREYTPEETFYRRMMEEQARWQRNQTATSINQMLSNSLHPSQSYIYANAIEGLQQNAYGIPLASYGALGVGPGLTAAMAAPAPAKGVKVVDAPAKTMLQRIKVEVQSLDSTRGALARDAEALLGYSGLRVHIHEPGRLRTALAKLEIEILDQKTVDKYKAQMVEHYRTTNKMPDPTWRLHYLRRYSQPVPEFVLEKAVQIKRELPEADFYVDQLAVDPFLVVSLDPLLDFTRNIPTRSLNPETGAYIEVWAEPRFEETA